MTAYAQARALIRANAAGADELNRYFSELSADGRVAACRTLAARDLARLFDMFDGVGILSDASLVPASCTHMTGVAHLGRNSLPVFRSFAKVFFSGSQADGVHGVWGYNRTGCVVSTFAGPGYFGVRQDRQSELLIDYTLYPEEVPVGFPKVRRNERGIASMVYGGMVDVLRPVSDSVSIGRAQKKGRYVDAWFVLVRESVNDAESVP